MECRVLLERSSLATFRKVCVCVCVCVCVRARAVLLLYLKKYLSPELNLLPTGSGRTPLHRGPEELYDSSQANPPVNSTNEVTLTLPKYQSLNPTPTPQNQRLGEPLNPKTLTAQTLTPGVAQTRHLNYTHQHWNPPKPKC